MGKLPVTIVSGWYGEQTRFGSLQLCAGEAAGKYIWVKHVGFNSKGSQMKLAGNSDSEGGELILKRGRGLVIAVRYRAKECKGC